MGLPPDYSKLPQTNRGRKRARGLLCPFVKIGTGGATRAPQRRKESGRIAGTPARAAVPRLVSGFQNERPIRPEAELAEFAHLHLHTEYSLLDGMGRTAEYAARAKDLGIHHIAVTDHGVMYGAMEWYRTATDRRSSPDHRGRGLSCGGQRPSQGAQVVSLAAASRK